MLDAETRRAFETLVAAAMADGDLSDAERQVLHRKATEWDVPLPMLNHLVDRGHQGQLKVAIPAEPSAKEDLFDQLIDIACADGRVEAAEYHLLAKFASHLGLALADVKARIRQRMEKKPVRAERRAEPRRETVVRQTVARPKPSPEPERPKGPAPRSPDLDLSLPPPPPPGPVPLEHAHAQGEAMISVPPLPPGPIQLPPPGTVATPVPDLPPITVELLKQAILFETEEDSLRYIERMMEVARMEAVEIRDRILRAFPGLRPAPARRRP
jgi:uncharacterized tellurite resistance protein B-like protein